MLQRRSDSSSTVSCPVAVDAESGQATGFGSDPAAHAKESQTITSSPAPIIGVEYHGGEMGCRQNLADHTTSCSLASFYVCERLELPRVPFLPTLASRPPLWQVSANREVGLIWRSQVSVFHGRVSQPPQTHARQPGRAPWQRVTVRASLAASPS